MATSYYGIADLADARTYVSMFSAAAISPRAAGFSLAGPYPGDHAFRLDGGSRHIWPVQVSTNLSGASAITIVCWFYMDALSSTQHITRVDHSGGNGAWRIVTNSSGNVEVGARSQNSDSLQSATAFSAGTAATWHFLAIIINFAAGTIGRKIDNGSIVTTSGLTFGASTLAAGMTRVHWGARPADAVEMATGAVYGASIYKEAKDNTFLESLRTAQLGIPTSTVGSNTASFTIDLKTFAGAAAASESGIDVVVLDAATGAACTRVLHAITGESSDGSGQLAVTLPNSLLNNGDTVLVGLTNTNGTIGVAAKQHFYPVQVTV